MASKNFDVGMAAVFKHEGGYVDHPADPGGATNLGITRATLSAYRGRQVSKAEVRALTKAEAKAIYKKQYWDTAGCDELPSGVDYAVFDYSVNSGPSRLIRTLQAALGVPADGVVGVRTLAVADETDARAIVNKICDRRLGFLRRLKTWSTFGRGWERRVEGVRKDALAMAGGASLKPDVGQPADPTPKAPEPPPVPPKKSSPSGAS
jgi:lysozyme family protein